MSHRRHGPRAFGVCLLAALGLTALIASAAHAENLDWSKAAAAELTWSIAKTNITATESLKVTTATAPELDVPGLGIQISCTTFTADDALIKTGGESSATLLFTGCSVLNAAKCIVKEPIESSVKDELRSHNGEDWDVFLPATGTVFVTIKIGGTNCAANNEAEGGSTVTGAVAALVGTEAVTQTISETGGRTNQATLFKLGLNYGNEPAELLGSASATLSGVNIGKNWGADKL